MLWIVLRINDYEKKILIMSQNFFNEELLHAAFALSFKIGHVPWMCYATEKAILCAVSKNVCQSMHA